LMLLGSCGDGGDGSAVEKDEEVVYEGEQTETARLGSNPLSVGGFVIIRS